MDKLYEKIEFHNNTAPALNEANLNAISKAIDDIDDRVIEGYAIAMEAGTYTAQCQEYAEECEGYVDDCEEIYNKIKEFDFDNGESEDF